MIFRFQVDADEPFSSGQNISIVVTVESVTVVGPVVELITTNDDIVKLSTAVFVKELGDPGTVPLPLKVEITKKGDIATEIRKID